MPLALGVWFFERADPIPQIGELGEELLSRLRHPAALQLRRRM
jgi:hypothetical protein